MSTIRRRHKVKRWPSGFKRMIIGILLVVIAVIFAPVVVAGVLYVAWRFKAVAIAIPIAVATTTLVIVFARAKISNIGFRLGVHDSTRLYRHPCTHCTGGAVTLNSDDSRAPIMSASWGKIPKKNRIWFEGTDHFHSPLANIKRCVYCHGRGFLLYTYPRPIPTKAERQEASNEEV